MGMSVRLEASQPVAYNKQPKKLRVASKLSSNALERTTALVMVLSEEEIGKLTPMGRML